MNARKIIQIISKKISRDPVFYALVLLIIAIAVFFRTYNYFERIGVTADNAWQIQVSRYAFDNLRIPLIGQFSSAAAFFYGPWYFWIFGAITILPLGILTHWYVMSLLSLFSIYLIFWIGREIGGKWTGVIAALYAAISSAHVNNSFDVWNPALIPFLFTLCLVFLLRFARSKAVLDLTVLSFVAGLSITIHFQSFLLVPVLLAVAGLIISQKYPFERLLKYLGIMALSFGIPFLPLLYFDLNHHFYNSTSLLVYLLVDQYKIWVPNRWLIYLFEYWPETWAHMIGGSRLVAMVLILALAAVGTVNLKRFGKMRGFYLLLIVFVAQIFMLRYYRGERFLYYSLFAQTPVIVLSAFATWKVIRAQKYLGFVLLIAVVVYTVQSGFGYFGGHVQTLGKINKVKNSIYGAFPNSDFDIYGCSMNGMHVSRPVALLMYYEGRNTLTGLKIGICERPDKSISWIRLTPNLISGKKPAYYNTSTEYTYIDTLEWWIKNPPKKGGDLWKFLQENWRLRH